MKKVPAPAPKIDGVKPVLVQGERGEPDIDSVEKVHRVAKAKKRKKAARSLGNGTLCRLVLLHSRPSPGSHVTHVCEALRQPLEYPQGAKQI
jgi:hypothetical protein